MKRNIRTIKISVLTALIVFAIGCSEYSAPTASQPTDTPTENFQYPPVEDVIATVEAAGYHLVNPVAQSSLDNCASVSTTRLCRTNNVTNLHLSGIVKLRVPGSVLPNNMDITIVAPSACVGVADFYPHPTVFNGDVEITWDLDLMVLPEGAAYSDILPLYVHDDGTVEEVSFTLQNNNKLIVTTNHFSRYILTSRVSF